MNKCSTKFNKINTAVILAGGLGTRLRSLISEIPKPMALINGKPFLEILLNYWIKQGVGKFFLSVGYKYEIIQNFFGNYFNGVEIEYVIEREPLGTGGGLLKALDLFSLNNPVLILNGDTFFKIDLKKFENFHFSNNSSWTFALFKTNEENRYKAISTNEYGKVIEFKKNTLSGNLFSANGGVYIIEPNIIKKMDFIREKKMSLEDEILPRVFEKVENLFAYEFDENFIDIGVPKDYLLAPNIINYK
tara:strand:- start:71 stop:811 length:741 start_codon:yes stop_codon:yes gene_type:complete